MSGLRMAFAAAFLIAGSAPTLAQELPRYDVEAHCRAVASFGGQYSASLDRSCFDMEQAAYDGLRASWVGLPSSMRGHCDEVARFGGEGSYSLLSSCIDMEQSAMNDRSGRSFKY